MAKEIVVIGGGAAGLMAAITAARQGAAVTLLEPNERLGKKVNITGKGRCNVTNDCDRETLLASIPGNGRFLYGALTRFTPRDTMAFFEALGVPLTVFIAFAALFLTFFFAFLSAGRCGGSVTGPYQWRRRMARYAP